MAGSSLAQREAWTPVPAVLLRSTGLPFELLETLVPSGPDALRLDARCERVVQLRARVRVRQHEFATTVFPEVVAREEAAGADRTAFRAWYRVRRDVERTRRTALPADLERRRAPVASWLTDWAALLDGVAAEHADLLRVHAAAVRTALAGLADVASDDRFAEAVFLSSPSMYDALHRYRARPGPRTDVRRIDLQLYSYLQRFTTKNDTASLYGPIDHGHVDADPEAPPLAVEVGRQPVTRLSRTAYWAADALAEAVGADPDVTPHLVPRLADGLAFDPAAGVLRNTASGRAMPLTGVEAGLLAAADARCTVAELDARLGDGTAVLVRTLVTRRWLTTTPRIPTAELDPMAWLRDWLSALPAGSATRRRWLPRIDEHLAIAARFADAALPDKVRLLHEAEHALTAATGRPPRRAGGELYADRTVLYDEARGDVSCRIGSDLLDELGRRLAPALHLSAAYSLVVQDVCRRRARAVLAELGGSGVPYLRFVDRLRRRVDLVECLAAPEVQAFRSTLYELVESRRAGDEAVLSAEDVAGLGLPVPAGTLVSPDLFLAATDLAALQAGDYDVIVGEVHHGAQVWTHLTTFWPAKDDLADALDRLLGAEDRLRDAAAPGPAAFVHGRRQGKAFPLELPGYSIEFGGRSTKDPSLVLGVGDLEVVDDRTGVALRAPRLARTVVPHPGDPRSIVNWVFGTPPVGAPPPPDTDRTPRLRVGGAVLWRRRWSLPGTALDAAHAAAEPADAQLLTTEVWHDRGVPRRSFVRLPEQRKPFYCDVADPLSVAHLLARTASSTSLQLTELLPEPDRWWLPASGGGRRSCEWRTTWVCGADGA